MTVEGEAVPVDCAGPRSVDRARGAAASGRRASVGHAAAVGGPRRGPRRRDGRPRDRTELIAAAVLALSILAGLTSWGALDLGGASSEAAPTAPGPSSD